MIKEYLKGFIGITLLLASVNASALLFWSDRQTHMEGTAKILFDYVSLDPTTYTNGNGRAFKGEYGSAGAGTFYANGITFVNSGITMNISTNAQTQAPIDSRYQSDSSGVKTANANLAASVHGLIAGHGTSSDNLINQTNVQALIDTGDIPNTVNAADFAGTEDPFDISTTFDISFDHNVVLNTVFFDVISHGGSDNTDPLFNQAPTFDITGGSNSLNLTGLNTVTATENGSTNISGGALFLAGELYTITVNSTGSLNSLVEFQAWDVTAVPLPATAWFLLGGLASLFGFGRKKTQVQA